jgi:hypothetical protein
MVFVKITGSLKKDFLLFVCNLKPYLILFCVPSQSLTLVDYGKSCIKLLPQWREKEGKKKGKRREKEGTCNGNMFSYHVLGEGLRV